eukprot:5141454-Pyramimonas_sp.AAC.1
MFRVATAATRHNPFHHNHLSDRFVSSVASFDDYRRLGGALGLAQQLAAQGLRALAQTPPEDGLEVPQEPPFGISGIGGVGFDWHGRQFRHAEEQAP